MTDIYIPDSFRPRPYATTHFHQIASWVLAHHPWYRQRIEDPAAHIPLLTRDEILDNNDALLNGHAQTGSTSGSTGVPVRFSWSRARSAREQVSAQLLLKWLGGPLPRRFRKNLDRIAVDFPPFENGIADSSGDRHMGA